MPERSRKNRPADVNQLAASIVAQATGEAEEVIVKTKPAKDAAAVSLGRRGGLKGGKARAATLTARQRSDIAKTAAQARWKKS